MALHKEKSNTGNVKFLIYRRMDNKLRIRIMGKGVRDIESESDFCVGIEFQGIMKV